LFYELNQVGIDGDARVVQPSEMDHGTPVPVIDSLGKSSAETEVAGGQAAMNLGYESGCGSGTGQLKRPNRRPM
jgi:hypothetical protein